MNWRKRQSPLNSELGAWEIKWGEKKRTLQNRSGKIEKSGGKRQWFWRTGTQDTNRSSIGDVGINGEEAIIRQIIEDNFSVLKENLNQRFKGLTEFLALLSRKKTTQSQPKNLSELKG